MQQQLTAAHLDQAASSSCDRAAKHGVCGIPDGQRPAAQRHGAATGAKGGLSACSLGASACKGADGEIKSVQVEDGVGVIGQINSGAGPERLRVTDLHRAASDVGGTGIGVFAIEDGGAGSSECEHGGIDTVIRNDRVDGELCAKVDELKRVRRGTGAQGAAGDRGGGAWGDEHATSRDDIVGALQRQCVIAIETQCIDGEVRRGCVSIGDIDVARRRIVCVARAVAAACIREGHKILSAGTRPPRPSRAADGGVGNVGAVGEDIVAHVGGRGAHAVGRGLGARGQCDVQRGPGIARDGSQV